MLKRLLILCVIVGAVSCQQEDQVNIVRPPADITERDGMLVFASEDVYANTLLMLDRMNINEQRAWAGKFNFSALTNILTNVKDEEQLIEEQDLSHLTPAHWFVLNNQRRVQVGDVVMQFSGKTKYFMKADEFAGLSDKRQILQSTWKGVMVSESIVRKEDANGRTYFDAWNNGNIGVGGQQHEFDSPGIPGFITAGKRKFVFEWVSSVEQTSSPSNGCGDVELRARLYLRCKNLRKSGSSWVNNGIEGYTASVTTHVDGVRLYYGYHNPANCNYTDTMWGPVIPYNGYFADINQATLGTTYSGNFNALIASPPDFYGEWHATFDLKKWEGYSTGTATMYHLVAGHTYTYNM